MLNPIKDTKEEMVKQFWDRVLECAPTDIKADSIKVVSDDDITWLLNKLLDAISEAGPKNTPKYNNSRFSEITLVKDKTYNITNNLWRKLLKEGKE